MSWKTESLGNLLTPSGNTRAGNQDLPVLSITMHDGLVDQSEKFKKRVASRDISNYRVVYTNELVVGFPIDEGVLGFQMKYPAAVVSPAYGIWKLKRPGETHIPFIEGYLRSGVARRIYASKMRGAVARRRSITREDFLEIEVPFPPFDEQRKIAAVLERADGLSRQRHESLELTEMFLQSVFIDMFGDPVRNSKHLPTEKLCQLAMLERGKFTPRPRNDPSYYNGKYPFIQTGDITRSKGRITSWTQTLNDKGAAVSKEFTPGTVVIAIVGATIGETAIVETPVYCPDSIIGITPFEHKATPEFIEFLLRQWKPRLKELAPDAARANLNLERLRPLLALAPPIEVQQEFSRIAKLLRSIVLLKKESEFLLDKMFFSIQQRAFRDELDLSRLVLEPSEGESVQLTVPAVKTARSTNAKSFLQAPKEVEAALKKMDSIIRRDGPQPWSAEYFKYRVLGTLPTPFTFDEVMQRVNGAFDEEPPYEEIKNIIFELLCRDYGPARLRQRFDLQIDEKTNEISGRKEIVFEPAS